MKKPNFFIIGAPKCGTTSLANWLGEHPQVYMVNSEEPHYFSGEGIPGRSLESYENLFLAAEGRHLAVGERSTSYLSSDKAVPAILNYQPNAKFIICVRNPLKMAPALHSQWLRTGVETEPNFRKAWDLQAVRRRGEAIPFSARRIVSRLDYQYQCKVGELLRRVYQYVQEERVLVILIDDMKRAPKEVYARTIEFLSLPPSERNVFPVKNISKASRSPTLARAIRNLSEFKMKLGIKRSLGVAGLVKKFNLRPVEKQQLDNGLLQDMVETFSDDIDLLQSLIGRDLASWKIISEN